MSETQTKDYYETLGISKESSPEEIGRAYKKMALKYHPDKNRDNERAKEKFIELNEAYKILSDSDKRKLYDGYQHNEFTKLQGKFGDNVFREIRKYSGQENYYDMLNIDKDASLEAVKVAYKQTLMSSRNFKTPNSKEVISKEKEAYKVLSNPEKRSLYDKLDHKKFIASYGKKDIPSTNNFKATTKTVNKYMSRLKKELYKNEEYDLQSAQRKNDKEQEKESYRTLSEDKIPSKLENCNIQSVHSKNISK